MLPPEKHKAGTGNRKFFSILIIIKKHNIFTCMYKLMSFQISYTVKDPSTDFTWMDVSENRHQKPWFFPWDRGRFQAFLLVTVCHLEIFITTKVLWNINLFFKMRLRKPVSSLQAWSSQALLNLQMILFRKYSPKS